MPTKKAINPKSIRYKSGRISEYLKAKDFAANRLWRLTKKGMKTLVNGKWIDEKTFYKTFPVPSVISFQRSTENADGRNNFLND